MAYEYELEKFVIVCGVLAWQLRRSKNKRLAAGLLPTHWRLLPTHFWEGPLGRAGGWVIGRESPAPCMYNTPVKIIGIKIIVPYKAKVKNCYDWVYRCTYLPTKVILTLTLTVLRITY